jgi:hypothetical protein
MNGYHIEGIEGNKKEGIEGNKKFRKKQKTVLVSI